MSGAHIVIVGLAALVCLAAVAALGGAVSERLDILTHVAPFYLALGVCVSALAAAPPLAAVGGRLALLGGVTILASLVLIAPEVLRSWAPAAVPAPARPADQITLVQFNAFGRNDRAGEAVSWIISQRPDIVIIEEGSAVRDELVRRGGYHLVCGGCAAMIFSKAEPVRKGSAGPLPDRPRWPMMGYATFRDARGEFAVVGLHHHWPSRIVQLRAERDNLERLLATLPHDRLIVAGDFNSTPWSFALRRLDRELGLQRRTRMLATWPTGGVSHYPAPAPFPFMPIDHVYAEAGWRTVAVRRGPRLGSDHYPVVVTLAPAP